LEYFGDKLIGDGPGRRRQAAAAFSGIICLAPIHDVLPTARLATHPMLPNHTSPTRKQGPYVARRAAKDLRCALGEVRTSLALRAGVF